jgi:hypothetical protein
MSVKIVQDGSVHNVRYNGKHIGNIFEPGKKGWDARSIHWNLKRDHPSKKDAVEWLVKTHKTAENINEMSNQRLGPYIVHAGLRNKNLKDNPEYAAQKLNKRKNSMNLALRKMTKNTMKEEAKKDDKVKLGGKTPVILDPTAKDSEVLIDKKKAVVERVMERYRLSETTLSTQKMGSYSAADHARKFSEHNTKSQEMHGLSMALDNYRHEHKRNMSSHEYKKLESHSKAALIAAHSHLKHAHDHLANYIQKASHEEVKDLKKHMPAIKKYLERKHLDESLLKKPSWITPKKPQAISKKLMKLMAHQKQNSQNIMRLNKEEIEEARRHFLQITPASNSYKKHRLDDKKEDKPPFTMPKIKGHKWDEKEMKYVKEGVLSELTGKGRLSDIENHHEDKYEAASDKARAFLRQATTGRAGNEYHKLKKVADYHHNQAQRAYHLDRYADAAKEKRDAEAEMKKHAQQYKTYKDARDKLKGNDPIVKRARPKPVSGGKLTKGRDGTYGLHHPLLTKEETLNELGIRKGRLLIGHVHLRKGKYHAVPGGGGPVKVFNNQDDAIAHVHKTGRSASTLNVESKMINTQKKSGV